MATKFQPPPTYAMPVIEDQRTKQSVFNPIWLKWFLDLSQNLDSGSEAPGAVTSVNGMTGAVVITNITGNAATATRLSSTTTWNIVESGGVLFFQVGGVSKAKLDASGNLSVVGDVKAYQVM